MNDVIVTLASLISGVCLALIALIIRCKWVYDGARILFEEANRAYMLGNVEAGDKLTNFGRQECDRADAMFIRRLMRI